MAARTIKDDRVQHYYDQDQLVGQALADRLGNPDEPLWDSYLFFDKEAAWENDPPVPIEWVHQVHGVWPEHFRREKDLVDELQRIVGRLKK